MRVEVPFEIVAPQASDIWKGDSGQELVVPIGRAGAMRLQSVRLGAGRRSTYWCAARRVRASRRSCTRSITNAALHYSPDQVEFYLIDFKKGVEFKTYATHHLPHARVIAIESEREFGLSVLDRLDGELRRRGDLFRKAGVQDLAGYRKARPGEAMPRSLLVIDEFQELFVEDDKLAQEAALLLDRLVRQGRAFGIHVLLGSQTLERGLFAGSQHDGADGGARGAAMQRGRRSFDPERRAEHGGPISEPARRGDLQRPERPLGG